MRTQNSIQKILDQIRSHTRWDSVTYVPDTDSFWINFRNEDANRIRNLSIHDNHYVLRNFSLDVILVFNVLLNTQNYHDPKERKLSRYTVLSGEEFSLVDYPSRFTMKVDSVVMNWPDTGLRSAVQDPVCIKYYQDFDPETEFTRDEFDVEPDVRVVLESSSSGYPQVWRSAVFNLVEHDGDITRLSPIKRTAHYRTMKIDFNPDENEINAHTLVKSLTLSDVKEIIDGDKINRTFESGVIELAVETPDVSGTNIVISPQIPFSPENDNMAFLSEIIQERDLQSLFQSLDTTDMILLNVEIQNGLPDD